MLCRSRIRAGAGFLILGFLAVSIGCGPNYKARATVKGKVTIGGKHLTVGSVTFHGKDNMTGSGTIDKNGDYVVKDAPLGDVIITVSVPSMPLGGPAMMKSSPALKGAKATKSVDPTVSGKSISIMGDMPSEIVPIPPIYANHETSKLTYTVTRGEHTHDIPLTP